MRSKRTAKIISAWAIGLAAAVAAQGGERVILSDAPPSKRQSVESRKSPGYLSLRSLFRRPSSSLDAVPALPFSMSYGTSGGAPALSKEALKMLDKRRNWIFLAPDDASFSEQAVMEALGVHLPKEEAGKTDAKSKSVVEQFLKGGSVAQAAAQPPNEPARPSAYKPTPLETPTPVAGLPEAQDASAGYAPISAAPELSPLGSGARDQSLIGPQTAMRSAAPSGLLPGSSLAPRAASEAVALGSRSVIEMLGHNPIQNPIDSKLGSLNLTLDQSRDLTRNALNPVAPAPLGARQNALNPLGARTGQSPTFAARGPLNARRSRLAGSLDPLTARPAASLPKPKQASSLLPKPPQFKSLKDTRVRLDLPGRTF
ncbi:MAG: hypothetical protein J7M29_09990 [Verrucomicrobia bacterium]|nr:hypothetical protein [Verrucomicrobiota bacterium]